MTSTKFLPRPAGTASLLIALFSIALMLFFVITPSSMATDIPPVYGIEIFEYDESLIHEPGTSGSYEVKIKNIGVLGLYGVELRSEKIQEDWFSSEGTINLQFGEVGTLEYELTVPETASAGLHAFSLIVWGSYGVGTVTDLEPVVLNIVSLPEPTTTVPGVTTTTTTITMPETTTTTLPETTTTTTQTTPPETTAPTGTTQPPIVSVSEELSKLIEKLRAAGPDIVFSKFRTAVTYVRTTAGALLTNEILLYKTVTVLFVVMIVLAGIRKIMLS